MWPRAPTDLSCNDRTHATATCSDCERLLYLSPRAAMRRQDVSVQMYINIRRHVCWCIYMYVPECYVSVVANTTTRSAIIVL